jgi:hypothetical protein
MKLISKFVSIAVIAVGMVHSPACFGQVPVKNAVSNGTEYVFRSKIGDSECQPLVAKNETSSTMTIKGVEPVDAAAPYVFSDYVKFPLRIAPGKSVTLCYICFRPKEVNNSFTAAVNVDYSTADGASTAKLSVRGSSYGDPIVQNIPATPTGAVLGFDPVKIKEGTLISIIGKDHQIMRSFTFKNTSDAVVSVTDLNFQQADQHFQITGIEPDASLPFDVAPGGTFSVRISYTSLERVPYTNHLMISTSGSKDPVSYEVRGYQIPLSSMNWNKSKDSTVSATK